MKTNKTKTTLKENREEETIQWYVDKFAMKMFGSSLQTARGWVEGCGQNKTITEKIWKRIINKYYK